MEETMYKIRLMNLGIKANVLGLSYLNRTLEMYQPGQMIGNLYIDIAKEHNTAPNRVERAIRHAISMTEVKTNNGDFIAKYKILWDEHPEAAEEKTRLAIVDGDMSDLKDKKVFTTITEKSKAESGNSDGFYNGTWEVVEIDYRRQEVRLSNGKVSILKSFDEVNALVMEG